MNITFYSFNKKPNSTATPSGVALTNSIQLECKLLDNTSVMNPTLLLESNDSTGVEFTPYNYNYAYISTFGRYYFIDRVDTEINLWIFYLSVDALASYRTTIRNSIQYVVRSSSVSDDNIVDTMYITKPMDLQTRNAVSEYDTGYVVRTNGIHSTQPVTGEVFYFNYENRLPQNGVCFGIIGGNGVGANYYVCTEDNFINFITQVFAFIPSDMGSFSDGLKKTLLDLEQYIVSVVRLPVMPDSTNLGVSQTSVRLGSHDIPCTCYSIIPGYHYEEYSLVNGITLPTHPNIQTHAYYGLPPFTKYTLDFLPIGSIPIDNAKMYGYNKLQIKWRVDFISGLAWFQVGYEPYYGSFITLYNDIAQVGIPIPLSQLKVDNQTGFGLALANYASDALKNFGVGGMPGFLGSGAIHEAVSNSGRNFGQSVKDLWNAAQRVFSGDTRKMVPASETQGAGKIGNFLDLNTNVLDQIINYAGELFGDVVTKGSTGTYLNIVAGVPVVRAFFMDQAENDNARFGSPLYQKKRLSTLTGFCVCKNATMDFASTDHPYPEEVRGIINMLNTGIYLE